MRLVLLPVSVSATALVGELAAHSRSQIKVVPRPAFPAQVVVLLTDLSLVPGQGAEIIGEGLGVLLKKGTTVLLFRVVGKFCPFSIFLCDLSDALPELQEGRPSHLGYHLRDLLV